MAMFSFSSPGVTWETLFGNCLRGGFAGSKIICKNWINKGESIKQDYWGADKSLARPDWKKQLKVCHFSSDAEVIAAAETWLNGQPSEIFVSGLQKLSLVAVACFLPGRAKDLSAPWYIMKM